MIVSAADSVRRKLGDGTCRTDRIDRREAEMRGINRSRIVFDCSPCRALHKQSHSASDKLGDSKGFNMPTFAFALLYALVHAGAKSGTSAGLSTGGG